jgi:hypothetical protein
MRYAELIQLYFDRSNALQWYWTLYVVVVGGLLAFSSLRVRRDLITASLVSVLFCCFAYKNLGAIHDTAVQRSAALQAVQRLAPNLTSADDRQTDEILRPALVAPDYDGVRTFHIASDVLTIAAIWAMELRRIRSDPNRAHK